MTLPNDPLNEMPKREMVIVRTFDAPVERVWQAWTDPAQIMRWWGPKGFTAPVARMDFREGGVSLVCMRSPGGQDLYNTWTYQTIVPMKRIEFIQHFADKTGKKLTPAAYGLPTGIPEEVPHVVTFKDLGNDKTELTVSEYGYESAQIVELSRAGMNQCLDKMASSLTDD